MVGLMTGWSNWNWSGIGSLTEADQESKKSNFIWNRWERLLPILSKTLADYSNVEIINNDILKVDVDKIIEERCLTVRKLW